MPVVQNFFCCFKLKYGCIFLGILEIINFMFLFLARIIASVEHESQLYEYDWNWYLDKAILLYGVLAAFCLVVGGMTVSMEREDSRNNKTK